MQLIGKMGSHIRPLQGMVAMITGGMSGLGRGCVERFVQQGMKVVIADIPATNGKNFANDFQDNALWTPMDVTREEDVRRALEQTEQRFGKLDAVINCAGIALAFKTYNFNRDAPHKYEDFVKVQMVNLCGTFNVSRLAAGLMGRNATDADKGRGVIINVSSVAAFEGQMGQVAYAASKGGIAAMTLPMARDLASQGIRVMCIAPGLFDTPLLQALPEKVRQFLATTMPFPRRLGRPEEFAHVCEMIMQNNMMNGEIVRIDGALRMQP